MTENPWKTRSTGRGHPSRRERPTSFRQPVMGDGHAAAAQDLGDVEADPAAELVDRNRERMARQIGNVVMTRLSRLGFDLSATAGLTSGTVQDRLRRAVEETDELVRLMRRIVVGADHTHPRDDGTVAAVEVLVADAAQRLQCSRRIRLHGDFDDLSDEIAQVVRVVLREALDGVVTTHSGVSELQVEVGVWGTQVDVMVVDDATTVVPAPRVGQQALETLAEGLRGGFSYQVRTPRGTIVRWSVPGSAARGSAAGGNGAAASRP